jgi:hypothetical protein
MTEERGPYRTALRQLKFWREKDEEMLDIMRQKESPNEEKKAHMEWVEARIKEYTAAIDLLEAHS